MSSDLQFLIWLIGVPIVAAFFVWMDDTRFQDIDGNTIFVIIFASVSWPLFIVFVIVALVLAIVFSPALFLVWLNSQRKRKNEELQGKRKAPPEYDPYRNSSDA